MDFNLALDVGDVGKLAGRKVVQDDWGVSLGDQGITQVRSDEACSTCKEYAHGAILGVNEGLLCGGVQAAHRVLRCNWGMTQSTRIYKHSAAGTDWAALVLGAGLGLMAMKL